MSASSPVSPGVATSDPATAPVTLTPEQEAFVALALSRPRLALLTGGPGTGKTTTLRELVRRLTAAGLVVAVAAPSGKAAQRASLALGRAGAATTVHALLGLRPGRESATGWDAGSDGDGGGGSLPDAVDVVIVDEASMVDAPLAAALVRAVLGPGDPEAPPRPRRTLLLLGDADQLPPVGPGQPFLDLLGATSPRVPQVRLTTVHRQALTSPIVRAAHAVLRGEAPAWAAANGLDLWTVEGSGYVPEAVERALREVGGLRSPLACQVLVPQSTTEAGTRALCATLGAAAWRERGSPGDPEGIRGLVVGDKVLHRKNDRGLGVLNGEVGLVAAVRSGGRATSRDAVEVRYDAPTPRTVVYRGGAISMLLPAWALTVHRCVHQDTLVATDRGLLPIGDIEEAGVIGTADGALPYHGWAPYRTSTGVRIVTEHGFELSATDDHRLLLADGRTVPAGEIGIGAPVRLLRGILASPGSADLADLPAAPSQLDVRTKIPPRFPVQVTSEVGELFGLLVADGTVFGRGLRLVKRHRDVVERFAELIWHAFGVRPKITAKRNCFHADCSSTAIARWLGAIDGLGPRAKGVPTCILRSPPHVQRAFLRGLFEDGAAHIKAAGSFSHIEWSTSYRRMGHVVQVMLLHLGIFSSRRCLTRSLRGVDRHCWRLWIYGKNAAAFRDEIGFVAKTKQDRLQGAGWSDETLEPVISEPVASVERIHLESVCVTVPGHGRFSQGGFDGSNSQGSEYSAVVLVATRAHAFMLTRALLYVALTRARERVIVVGQAEAVAAAARRTTDARRATLLGRLLGSSTTASAKKGEEVAGG